MAYRIKLNMFEGPLDLLLFLIKKEEVDIYDIPIAEITRQFMEYVELITLLDLETAGDFILVAATLIRIKAQMLLPKNPEEGEEEEEDPRQELVRRLLEYQQFKEVALKFGELEAAQRDFFRRGFFDYDFSDAEPEFVPNTSNLTLFDLMAAFKRVLMRVPKETQHRVEDFPITIEDQIDYILQEIEVERQLLFVNLLQKLPGKIYMIVTFIALLEMMRRGLIEATQSSPYGEIWIRKL
jgi:segregation and condensation protein A